MLGGPQGRAGRLRQGEISTFVGEPRDRCCEEMEGDDFFLRRVREIVKSMEELGSDWTDFREI